MPKKQNIAFIISQFNPKRLNVPIPFWCQHIQKITDALPKKNITILSLFSYRAININSSTRVIPMHHNLLRIYFSLRNQNFDEIYIIGSYFSNVIFLLLSPININKQIYFVRNRLPFFYYLKTLSHLGTNNFHLFYLLSTLNLSWVYKILDKYYNIKTFIFPTPTSLSEFTKNVEVSSKKCEVWLSPLKKFDTDDALKLISKPKKETWITYAGRAPVNRGLKILIDAFKKVHQKNYQTKLILLLLPPVNIPLLHLWLKDLPLSSYYLSIGPLKPNHYAGYLLRSDCLVSPFTLTYDFPHRPATILEAMSLGIPCIMSSAINDSFFKNNYNCLRFKNFNEGDLINKINQILTQPELRKRLSKNAKLSIKRTYNQQT